MMPRIWALPTSSPPRVPFWALNPPVELFLDHSSIQPPSKKKKKIPEKQLENLEIAGKHLDLLQYAVEVITVQKLKIVA